MRKFEQIPQKVGCLVFLETVTISMGFLINSTYLKIIFNFINCILYIYGYVGVHLYIYLKIVFNFINYILCIYVYVGVHLYITFSRVSCMFRIYDY